MSTTVVEEVLSAVRAGGLLDTDRPVVAMLSGGRDSVCLIDIAVTLCGASAVRALHVNYGLRTEAAEDEECCRALCHELGVELQALRADKPTDAGNTQAWARTVRYEAAQRLAASVDGLFAAGHTATDQVETILYRLAASPGRRALLGMASAEGRLIRPLLSITREQTAAYCEARGLSWREDESNASDKYARGRVRAGLLPALRAVHPGAQSNVLRTAQLLGEETQLLERLVSKELAGESSIALEHLEELPRALARLIVVRLAEDAAKAYVPQAGDRVSEIVALGRRGGDAQLHVGGLVSAVLSGGRLSMIKIQAHYTGPGGH
jgi:tRNA(Ile)-lysidine synthase